MGISMYNASGYRDPTAYAAISRAESFRIDHSTGYIHINMDTFFPCPVKKAQKFFRLVCLYCSQEQQEWLMRSLLQRADRLEEAESRQKEKLENLNPRDSKWREESNRLRQIRSAREQLQRNIRDYEPRRGHR